MQQNEWMNERENIIIDIIACETALDSIVSISIVNQQWYLRLCYAIWGLSDTQIKEGEYEKYVIQ